MWGEGEKVVDGRVLDKAGTDATPIGDIIEVDLEYAILIEDIVGVGTLVVGPAGVDLRCWQGFFGAGRYNAEHRRTGFPRHGAGESGKSIASILGK